MSTTVFHILTPHRNGFDRIRSTDAASVTLSLHRERQASGGSVLEVKLCRPRQPRERGARCARILSEQNLCKKP